jgi:hypothetical protein
MVALFVRIILVVAALGILVYLISQRFNQKDDFEERDN